MTNLTSEELNWLLRSVADSRFTVTWNTHQGKAVFDALHAWFKAQIPSLYQIMNEAARGAIGDEAKERFLKRYMQ